MTKITKYYYNSVSLMEHCKLENISYTYTVAKLKKLKNKDEFKKLSDNDIIKYIMDDKNNDSIGSNVKYYYNNIPLRKYCTDNNYSYEKILNKISKLKLRKEYHNKSDRELTMIAIESKSTNPIGRAAQYYYENMSLRKYCMLNGLDYKSILHKLKKIKEDCIDSNIADEELIKLAINTENSNNIKYFYEGTSLIQYCKDNNLNYNSIVYKLRNIKKQTEHEKRNTTELIDFIIANETQDNVIYSNI